MGRAPCCEKVGLKRGRWTAEEDDILKKYIEANGEGSWRSLPKNAGLLRCGKSCRLRWINYLRSDLKRGNISVEEEEIIINLHASLGNRWSLIAGHLPGRTDNEIKNYWNSHLSRKIQTFRRPNPHFIPPPVAAKLDRRAGRRAGRPATKRDKNNSDRKVSNPTPSEQREDSNGGANAAVVMPTTPTPEKESLFRTTQRQENCGGGIIPESSPLEEAGTETGAKERISRSLCLDAAAGIDERESGGLLLPVNEGTGICEGIGTDNGVLCLDDIIDDLGGIWALEKEIEIGAMQYSGVEESGPGNGSWKMESAKNVDWNNLMSSPGNSREFSGVEESGPGKGNCKTKSLRNGDFNSGEWDWGQEENTFSWLWDGDDDGNMEFNDGISFEMDTEKHNALVSWLMS